MSKIEKIVEVPATTRVVTERYCCDLCAATTKDTGIWPPASSSHAVNTTEVTMEVGASYGTDGGHMEETAFDICPECFTTKLVPWLESQGAKPRTTKSDW